MYIEIGIFEALANFYVISTLLERSMPSFGPIFYIILYVR